MTKTMELLEEKNKYLEKFLGLNSKWLERLSRSDFGDIEEFRETREEILNIIKYIDALVESHANRIEAIELDNNLRIKVNALLVRKDSLVKAILSQDLDIMQFIDCAKTQVIQDLRNVQKTKKTIGSYKSFNRKDTVDEEA